MTMTESDPISLRQAVSEGLFVSIDAARKAAHRDPRFPGPTVQDGSAFLYDAAALRAYAALKMKEEPPGSDLPGETWKPIPGAGYYEASNLGRVRSVSRTIDGRSYEGRVLKPREDGDGYLRVNITNDARERQHNVSVARLVLMAHDPDGHKEGMESCHGPGGRQDNRLSNLRWDTKDANREEALAVRLENRPPKPKPPKVCPRCEKEHRDRGRNCHACVVKLGIQGARLRAAGVGQQEAGDRLDYPPLALEVLAERYGGLRHVIVESEVAAAHRAVSHVPSPQRRLRSVLFHRQASRRNSDAE